MPRLMPQARPALCSWRNQWPSPGRRTIFRSMRYCPGGSTPISPRAHGSRSRASMKKYWPERRPGVGEFPTILPELRCSWRRRLRISSLAWRSRWTAAIRPKPDLKQRLNGHLAEEALDFEPQVADRMLDRFRRITHDFGRAARLGRRAGALPEHCDHVIGAFGCTGDAAGDFPCRQVLL